MKRTFNARPKQPPAHSGGKVNNLKTPFRNDIMVAGVVIANDTFGGDFDWLVGGDDDTFFFLSVLVPFLNSLDAEKPLFIGSPGPSYIGPWYCRRNTLDDDNHPELLAPRPRLLRELLHPLPRPAAAHDDLAPPGHVLLLPRRGSVAVAVAVAVAISVVAAARSCSVTGGRGCTAARRRAGATGTTKTTAAARTGARRCPRGTSC